MKLPIVLLIALALRAQAPSDADIRAILADRIDTMHRNVGISVGVIDAGGARRFVSYGAFGIDDPRKVDRDSVFEIGSITKVFTSLVLADMVQRGEVSLDDPVAKYLPPDVQVPERGGRKITLMDLATQTSGLPRMPSNFAPKDPNNPYADYPAERMHDFLRGYTLTRDIGTKYEYSNLGVGLLGQALAHRAGTDYDALIRARITGPLKMDSTGIALSPSMKQRLAHGHTDARQPAANWDLPAFAGAGALRSDAADMLIFLAANLGYVESPLAKAMAAMTRTRRPGPSKDIEIALAWHITHHGDREIVLAQRRHRRLPHMDRLRPQSASGCSGVVQHVEQCGRYRPAPDRFHATAGQAHAAVAPQGDHTRSRGSAEVRRRLQIHAVGHADRHPPRHPDVRATHRPAQV